MPLARCERVSDVLLLVLVRLDGPEPGVISGALWLNHPKTLDDAGCIALALQREQAIECVLFAEFGGRARFGLGGRKGRLVVRCAEVNHEMVGQAVHDLSKALCIDRGHFDQG